MRIIAFDLSLTRTGWAYGAGGVYASSGIISTKDEKGKDIVDPGVHRVRYIRDLIMCAVEKVGAELVIFEGFAHAAKGNAIQEIGGMTYAIWAELVGDKIPYITVAPQTLKRFAAGRGSSPKNPVSKEIIIREVYRRFGIEVDDNNQADAICLLFIGMGLVGEWEAQTEVQMDVLKTLREKNSNSCNFVQVAK